MNQNSKLNLSAQEILNSSGFSTLELLIAMVILITAISGSILVVFGGTGSNSSNPLIFQNQTISLDNQANNEALALAESLIEQAMASASMDFNSLVSSSSYNFFDQELTITDVNPCKKIGVASVSWSTDQNRPQLINLETTFTNYQEAFALSGDCGPSNPPPTAWLNIVCENPLSPTWDFSPGGPTATGIDLIERGGLRYAVITENASATGNNDFWIVNVTNRASLGDVSSIDIVDKGLNDVDVSGNYAFVANDDISKQLQVINIANILAPVRVASVSLNTTVTGSQAKAIHYHNNRVYVGTDYISPVPHEFQIFDVSNPLSPTLIPGGTYNVDHNIYKIIVRNQVVGGVPKVLAYLAVSDSVGDKPKMIILDVTNPTSGSPVSLVGSYNVTPTDALYGTSLFLLGDNAYLGRERANSGVGDFISLDISNPVSPTKLDSEILGMANGDLMKSIIVSGNYLFSVNTDNQKGFQVWSTSNPSNLTQIGTCKYPQDPIDMEFDGNFIYVVNKSQDALRIIYDAANPFP
jgi:hypothetical protein